MSKELLTKFIEGVKDSLNLGGKGIVGIDIGLSAIKVSEVIVDGKGVYTLNRYASVKLPEGSIIEDEIQKPDEVVEAIKQALEKSGIQIKNAAIGLFGPNTVSKKLQLAGGSEEEIEDQVMWEAEQYLPFDIEESSVAFHVVGENEGGGVDVIIGAARKDTLLNFTDIISSAGLKAKVVDIGVLAVVNVFEHVLEERLTESDSSWILIDLGAQKINFVIYKNGIIQFTKEINIGGVMITEEIQRQMGVTYEEAEDLKINGDENGNLPEEILAIIDDIVESFFAEIKKTIDFYSASSSDDSIENCIVTGGGSLIPGLLEGVEALLGVEASVLNPFEVIKYNDKNIKKEEISEIAYQAVQSIGLGMRVLP